MWVIYCQDTGEEIDRVESRTERDNVIREYNANNSHGFTASSRWED